MKNDRYKITKNAVDPNLEFCKDDEEEIIFDADRDNQGHGVSADEMLRILRSIK